MTPGMKFALNDILPAILLIAVSVPLILNKIPPNRWYGIRIKKAFRSDEDWYRINAYGGKALVLWSLVLLAIGVLKLFMPLDSLDSPLALIWMIGPLLGCCTAAIIQTLVYARKL